MSTILTNANYIKLFDARLKSYNNIFFKTLQDDELLKETIDIETGTKALNIGANTYRTDQFNEFIRNIINFDIKNYTDLVSGATGTNLEFVNKVVAGSTTTYSFNTEVRDNIVDTLKILNVFVDILEAYKHCIDNDIATINTGYNDEIEIDRIEIVSLETRFYVTGSSTPIPAITEKNVGYIRNTRTSGSVEAKNVLYLSIQSFYTGLTTANYNNIFKKTNILGTYTATDAYDKITQQIFQQDDRAETPLKGLELAKKDYARHYYDKAYPEIGKTNLTKDDRNKNVVSLLLKCIFNIDPTFRKQSVYGLYYYYKFVQLYATLIINVSNVMYADVYDTSANPKRIDTYNTGVTYSVTAIEVTTPGIGYPNSKSDNTITITGGGATTAATAASDATGNIPIGESAITITDYGLGYTQAPTASIATAPIKYQTATTAATNAVTTATTAYQGADGTSGALGAWNTAVVNTNASSVSITPARITQLRGLINNNLTIADIEIGDLSYKSVSPSKSDITIKDAVKAEATPLIDDTTYDTYITLLIQERKKFLVKEERLRLKNAALAAVSTTSPTDTTAIFKATIVPLAFANITTTQNKNIDRLKEVIDDIEIKITSLITELQNKSINVNDEELIILTNNVDAKIKLSAANNNVVIMIAATSSTTPNNVNNRLIYGLLNKYNRDRNFKEDYSVYDTKNKIYYDIVNINDTPTDFEIEIDAVTALDATKSKYKQFYNYDNTEYTGITTTATTITNVNGAFLQIKKKDINGFKNKYVVNKKAVDELNANISLNTNRVNNQKNLYETQYNKNVFLSRQILTYNILICTIVVVLIGINVINMDKPLVKSISLACLGIIILLFIIYFMSNITYIETFAIDASDITILKRTAEADRNITKVSTLRTNIDKLNAQFIRYFDTIMITLPISDSVNFYKEISSVINADIENKTYLDKILDFNSSQGNTNMDTLKYELENNKLYILTLLISAIIFIGLYNIYINYIDNDKYLSLMIFIAIIIFIVIGSYYIINSNRRVRTIHKNIYWGPQSSESF